VTDVQGRPVPTAGNKIHFAIAGAAKIIGVGNGNPSSQESDKADERSLFNGLAQVIVQSESGSGEMRLTASGEGLQPAQIAINVKPAAGRPMVP